jgi:hypothetical protein
MPKTTFNDPQPPPPREKLSGDYPFQVVAFEKSISQGAKTRGSDVVTLKLRFFRDATFSESASQWEEDFIFHPSCEWKLMQFLLAANFRVGIRLIEKGDEIEIEEHNTIGLRGWATCKPEEDRDKGKIDDATGKVKTYNRVVAYITNKPKLAKHVDLDAPPVPEDDVPF